jgi:hypothetical protein
VVPGVSVRLLTDSAANYKKEVVVPFFSDTHPLDNEVAFPTLSFETLHHGTVEVPEIFKDQWGIVLIYRGEW